MAPSTRSKCVEIAWNVTPFRADEFLELWAPYATAAIDFGANGYELFHSLDDTQIVTQYAFFDNKDDWENYWYSDRLSEGRQKVSGMHTVPLLYTWQEVVARGEVKAEA